MSSKPTAAVEINQSFVSQPVSSQVSQIQDKYEPVSIQVFVESNIEFTIVVPNPNLTCGWLQSEVIRRYYEVL